MSDSAMSDALPPSTPGPRLLYRYEVRIRTRLGPALTATFARLAGGAVVPRHGVRRLAVMRDGDEPVDLPAVVQRLTECDVAVLDARLCRPSTARRSG
jgi:hypothetical protein